MPFHLRMEIIDVGKDILCPDNDTTCILTLFGEKYLDINFKD